MTTETDLSNKQEQKKILFSHEVILPSWAAAACFVVTDVAQVSPHGLKCGETDDTWLNHVHYNWVKTPPDKGREVLLKATELTT